MARLKKPLLSALFVVLLLPMTASAASFSADRDGVVTTFWHSLLRTVLGSWRAGGDAPVHLKSGPEMDPNGGPKPAGTSVTSSGSTTESGPEMDPNG
jgi:hypothetical protein